jgi:hypothetical protein
MMTMWQRLARAMKTRTQFDPSFEHYYAKLLDANSSTVGLPSAREAQRDLTAAREAVNGYYGRL